MAASYDFSTLDGQLKERYAKKITRAVPNNRHIQKAVPFSNAEMVGLNFNCPVLLTSDGGFSYTDPAGGLATLNDGIAAQMKNAEIAGAEMIERTQMTYSQLARSVANGAAFENTFDVVMKGMVDASSKRLEIQMLHGQVGIGRASTSANASATATVITFTAASWASAIWSGSESNKLQFYTSNTTLVSSGADSVFTITAVNTVSRTVSVSGTATGITALDTAILNNAGLVDAYWQSAFGLEMVGLSKIMQNTGSLFGIDAAAYSLWKSNNITTSGALTQAKILDAVAQCANLGLSEDMVVFVNPTVFNTLSSDQSTLRVYDSSYNAGEGVNGFKGLKFHAPSGVVTIVPHMFCKAGEVLGINMKDIVRIGASDITFQTPGKGSSYQMFWDLPTQNGCELRLYSHQAILVYRPAQAFRLTGFTV